MKTKYTYSERSKIILEEIEASFEIEELLFFKSFEEFWDEVDVQQAYEECWEEEKAAWKPFYKENFKKLRGEKI